MDDKADNAEWRNWMTDEERETVAYIEQARRDFADDMKTIRNRCYQRARRSKNSA